MKKVFILLMAFTVAFPTSLPAKCKIKPPTKKSLEAAFGKPENCYSPPPDCRDDTGKKIKCLKPTDAKLCFRTAEAGFAADFKKSGKVIGIYLSDPCNYYLIMKFAEKIVPPEMRGKFIKRTRISGESSCLNEYVEEYECVKIIYSNEMCMGCAPGSVTITWN